MSAYNQARFNLAQYNISAGSENWAEGAAKAVFGFSFAGETIFTKGNARLSIGGDLSLNRGRIPAGTAAAVFSSQAYINSYMWVTGIGSTVFQKELNLSQEAYANGSADEEITAELNLSQEAYAIGSADGAITAELNLSQKAFAEGDAGEVFSQTADIVVLSESVCAFPNLTLKPGQTLIIDAGSYNVLLDGQNAIHLQQGDWLDDLSRRTQSIVISGTGATRLEAQIIYTERYL